jgi:hypothetical protein
MLQNEILKTKNLMDVDIIAQKEIYKRFAFSNPEKK